MLRIPGGTNAVVIVVALGLGLAFAAAPPALEQIREKAEKRELAKLEGKWLRISISREGVRESDAVVTTVTIRGNRIQYRESGVETGECLIALAPLKSASEVDIVGIGAMAGKRFCGVYSIEGEVFAITYHPRKRPASISSTSSGVWSERFRRLPTK